VTHHVEPDAELVTHWRRQRCGVGGEQADNGGCAVFLEQAGVGEDVGDHGGGVFDPRQQSDVAAADRPAGGVLDAEHDPHGKADLLQFGAAPAVADGWSATNASNAASRPG
jgi:hypothetical protein